MLSAIAGQLDHLEACWDEVGERCAAIPSTLAHADFVPKNMTVRLSEHGAMLLPFDWETASWGPPAVDLPTIDLELYWTVYCSYEPPVTLAQVRDTVGAGNLFRLILAISWAAVGALNYGIVRDILRLSKYRLALEKLLETETSAGDSLWASCNKIERMPRRSSSGCTSPRPARKCP
jgi:aminoglycoside phosphotransferase (APT) family kinase protein